MSRIPDETTNRRAEEAAYASGVLKLSHADIAARMQMTPSNVSRLLARAAKLGCYSSHVVTNFYPHAVSKERLEQLQGTTGPRDLLSTLQGLETDTGVRVRRVHVLHTAGRERAEGVYEPMARFGRAAAARVAEMLAQASVVACTWGVTLSVVVDGLRHLRGVQPVKRPITFVPVCAEAEEVAGRPDSSSALAHRLNDAVNGGKGLRLAVTRVPAFIPKRHLGTEGERGMREMIWASRMYRSIFGTPNKGWVGASGGWVDRADMLLTSIGDSDHPMGFNYDELLRAGDITAARLKKLIIGDIGGILIHRPTVKDSGPEVSKLNRMWTGLEYERLVALALRAAKSDGTGRRVKPGVVVISAGTLRAETLEAVVRRGLANELILDAEAATALGTRLQTNR
jgi:DNA-binding transcriptional regulator LsrR (DeoR family)